MHKNWTTSLSVAALLAFSTAALADDASSRQLECRTPLNLDEDAVMTLPIGKEQFELVTMTLNGMEYAAAYVSDGLEHRWHINPEEGEEVSSDYQVIVEADLTAGYYDFTGLEVGEEREAKTVFFCRFTAETRYQTSNTEAAADSGALARYVYAIQQTIQRNWVRPPSAVAGLECVVNVRQLPGGEVVGATIGQCNGDAAVRRSIEAAVLKASPLPLPEDPNLFQRDLRITFKPEE